MAGLRYRWPRGGAGLGPHLQTRHVGVLRRHVSESVVVRSEFLDAATSGASTASATPIDAALATATHTAAGRSDQVPIAAAIAASASDASGRSDAAAAAAAGAFASATLAGAGAAVPPVLDGQSAGPGAEGDADATPIHSFWLVATPTTEGTLLGGVPLAVYPYGWGKPASKPKKPRAKPAPPVAPTAPAPRPLVPFVPTIVPGSAPSPTIVARFEVVTPTVAGTLTAESHAIAATFARPAASGVLVARVLERVHVVFAVARCGGIMATRVEEHHELLTERLSAAAIVAPPVGRRDPALLAHRRAGIDGRRALRPSG